MAEWAVSLVRTSNIEWTELGGVAAPTVDGNGARTGQRCETGYVRGEQGEEIGEVKKEQVSDTVEVSEVCNSGKTDAIGEGMEGCSSQVREDQVGEAVELPGGCDKQVNETGTTNITGIELTHKANVASETGEAAQMIEYEASES